MNCIWTLVLLATCVFASPVEEKALINGENGWYVPQEDGTLQWIYREIAEKRMSAMEADEERLISTHPVTYYLYTRQNPTKGQKITDTSKSIAASYFDKNNPTRFVIHGWTQSYTAGMNKEIRDAWLSRGNYNIIVVDWARARSVEYASSVVAVSTVGKKVAQYIDYLSKIHGMRMDTLTVIGHSLGAHVAGYAGKNVKAGKIHTIVGLDPALPLFTYSKTTKRLASTDATYVETIQTNGGTLGFLRPIGKASFYPNGGETQPGCPLDVTGACSHARSCTYYAESVAKNTFPTFKCDTYQSAVKKSCGSTYSNIRMGAPSNAVVVSGEYYVPVNSKSPFGKGVQVP